MWRRSCCEASMLSWSLQFFRTILHHLSFPRTLLWAKSEHLKMFAVIKKLFSIYFLYYGTNYGTKIKIKYSRPKSIIVSQEALYFCFVFCLGCTDLPRISLDPNGTIVTLFYYNKVHTSHFLFSKFFKKGSGAEHSKTFGQNTPPVRIQLIIRYVYLPYAYWL
jgi:hypothetical protein